MHDGSLGSIRDVLEYARTGAMGTTAHLTAAQMDDLEAYVLSL